MTRCKEFYEKLERDGEFCGCVRKTRDAMRYWREYRQSEERNGNKSPLSEREWLNQQRGLKQSRIIGNDNLSRGTIAKETRPEPESSEPLEKEMRLKPGTSGEKLAEKTRIFIDQKHRKWEEVNVYIDKLVFLLELTPEDEHIIYLRDKAKGME